MKYTLTALAAGLLMVNAASAATAIDLRHQPVSFLQHYVSAQKSLAFGSTQTQLKQVHTDIDFNKTSHTRVQQTFAGLQVWDATAVIHTPNAGKTHDLAASLNNNATMNGVIYEGLDKDLSSTAFAAMSTDQEAKALEQAKLAYARQSGQNTVHYKKQKIQKIIFIDDNKKAHYAYVVSLYVDDGMTGAHRPTVIMDASTLRIYRSWDQVMTINPLDTAEVKAAVAKLNKLQDDDNDDPDLFDITAGGIGGNEKKALTYDGASGNKPAAAVKGMHVELELIPGTRTQLTICGLANKDIMVLDTAYGEDLSHGICVSNPHAHNGVAWLSMDNHETRWKEDEVNDGYSPALDAFYAANTIKQFYHDWYGVPALVKEDGVTPMTMIMRVHYGRNYDNAFWDGEIMTFGDGGKLFYPLTSLDVAAHEISHGFTSQHSNIDSSNPQMGALHESFSDMAAVSIQYYLNNTNSWDIGRDVKKDEGALRYLDNPRKDGTSIDNMNDFVAAEAHAGAGIFNKAFYLIATTNGWNTQKAFNIMVKANMHYWTSSMTTLPEAACGVLSATKDYNYNIADVRVAFTKVGINTDQCDVH